MSPRTTLAGLAIATSLYAVLQVSGCGGGGSSGSGGSSGAAGTGGTSGHGGSHGSGGTSGTSHDSGPSKDAPNFDTGADVDGGGCPADTSAYKPMAYTSAVAHQGKCTSTDIMAFTAACGDSFTTTGCDAWRAANAPEDGGAGTPCGQCIFAKGNNGAAWTDPRGIFEPNYAACIQLMDATNGPMCAPAFDAVVACVGLACDPCSNADYNGCLKVVESTTGPCGTYQTTYNSACMTDLEGGVSLMCAPGGGSTIDPDYMLIIDLICGSSG